MQMPKEYPFNPDCIDPGLKTLIYSEETHQNPRYPSFIINSYTLCSRSPPISPSSLTTSSLFRSLTHSWSSSSVMDDLIGTESGVLYMNSDDHEEELLGVLMDKAAETPSNCNLSKRNQRNVVTKEYPPPITLLARTGFLPRQHKPWVLTRHCTNGHLVLKEEIMKHHQYFEAIRENGRLILNVVLLDDNAACFNTISERYDNPDLGIEDLKFIREEQEIEEEKKLDEYQETEADDDDGGGGGYFDNLEDETMTQKGSIMMLNLRSQMPKKCVPKKCLEDEDEEYGVLRSCFTYSGKKNFDSTFFCNGNMKEHGGSYSKQPSGSAPLAFPVRRMTTVMCS